MGAPFLAWIALLCVPARAQERAGSVTVEVRVGSAERGAALIDRGSVDGLAEGDLVLFFPRGGGTRRGTIVALEERAARVELAERELLLAPGTRGEVQVPRERAGRTPARPALRPAPGRAAPAAGDPPAWQRQDDDWQPGEPLLARLRPVRPEDRARSFRGRSYAILDTTRGPEDGRSDSIARLGSGLVVENLLGRADRLQADVEWSHHRADLPDGDGGEEVELRLDRLSYSRGGTRFAPARWEVGRFLQGGMPELGVLDGIEWSARSPGGHRYGASAGFLPEPDGEYESGDDFQLAAHYRWVLDGSERLSAAAAYQKTFHDGAADRDLVVASLRRLPRAGWTTFCTAWIDFYTGGDDEKGTLLGLTQAYLSTGRRWQDGSSLDLVYSHLEFPELERDEFLPVTDDQLADDHAERLALRAGLPMTRTARLRTGLGGWVDEDEAGGDLEIGLDLAEVFRARDFARLDLFATRARFETALGVRAGLGQLSGSGGWAIDYELSNHRLDGFSSANDDLPQHRLRFRSDRFGWHGWDLSWRLEGVLYDDEAAVTFGLYLERSY